VVLTERRAQLFAAKYYFVAMHVWGWNTSIPTERGRVRGAGPDISVANASGATQNLSMTSPYTSAGNRPILGLK
jgi:hypothetical protein